MYLCVHVSVYVHVHAMKSARTFARRYSVLNSFEMSILLFWGAKGFAMSLFVTYLFRAKVTPLAFFRYFCWFCLSVKCLLYRNYFNRQLLGKWVWAFRLQKNKPPTWHLPSYPLIWEKNRENFDIPLSSD